MRLFAFLALYTGLALTPLSAQPDALIGAWSHELDEDGEVETSLLQIHPDGAFRLEISLTTDLNEFFGLDLEEFEFEEDFDEEEGAEDAEEPSEEDEAAFIAFLLLGFFELGEGEISTTIEGEWEAVDGDLTLSGHITELAIDDQPLDEFFVAALTALVEDLAELEEELAEEFEEDGEGEEDGDTEEETPPTPEEIEAELATIGENIAAAIDELFAEEIVQFFTFSVEGDELFLMDEDEDETVWDRVPLASAVEASSWGQIKRLPR